jgi:hemoglobin
MGRDDAAAALGSTAGKPAGPASPRAGKAHRPAVRLRRSPPFPMKLFLLPAAFVLALAALPASAQTEARSVLPGTVPIPADDALYRELGGRDAIQRFTDDFYDRLLADARIAHFFDGLNARSLTRSLADYFCVVAGGPCTYEGVSMVDAHAGLGIRRADFNALVEHLQEAMDAAGLPFPTQNRLLARLAFSHRDIVTP